MTDHYDTQALTGAAEFFEELATGANPHPLAFAQAIRRVLADKKLEAEIEAALSEASEITAEGQANLDASWEYFLSKLAVAKVINDNQPENHALIEVLLDPPTLPVGTLLYTHPQEDRGNG
jgi:hypothetical protein